MNPSIISLVSFACFGTTITINVKQFVKIRATELHILSLSDVNFAFLCSEKYMVKLTKHGMPVEIELLGKQFGIFQVSLVH